MGVDDKDLTALSNLIEEKLKGVKRDVNNGFRNLNLKLDNQKTDLKRIELQTIKTNGRVTDLEKKTSQIELHEVEHMVTCPQIEIINELKEDLEEKKADSNKKIQQLNDDLLEYRMLKRYPKISLAIVAITCILLITGVFLTLNDFKKEFKQFYSTEQR
jgi:hypothetical protein